MNIGQSERATQNRVIALFRDEMGYRYLGDWTDRKGNSNIEEKLLTAYLTKCGYTAAQISKALYELRTEANNPNRSLYDMNTEITVLEAKLAKACQLKLGMMQELLTGRTRLV